MKEFKLILFLLVALTLNLNSEKLQISEINDNGLIFRVSFKDHYYNKTDSVIVKCSIINTRNDSILVGLREYSIIDTLTYTINHIDSLLYVYGKYHGYQNYAWHNVFAPLRLFKPNDEYTYYIKFYLENVISDINIIQITIGFDFFKYHNLIKILTEHYKTPGEMNVHVTNEDRDDELVGVSIGDMQDNEWYKYHSFLIQLHREMVISVNFKLSSKKDKSNPKYEYPIKKKDWSK